MHELHDALPAPVVDAPLQLGTLELLFELLHPALRAIEAVIAAANIEIIFMGPS